MPSTTADVCWEHHLPEIRKLYLIEDKSLKDVMTNLESRHGLKATKGQWVSRLRQWGFQKNLDKNGWKYVDNQTRKRKREGKESEVILSGVILPRKKVQKAIANHCFESTMERLNPRPPPSPPAPHGVSIVVRTPPPSLDLDFDPWPKSLPWFHFQFQTLKSLESLMKQSAVKTAVASPFSSLVKQFSTTASHLSSALTHQMPSLVGNANATYIEQHRQVEQTQQLLSKFMPEEFPDEHVARAKSLCHQGSQSRVHELLEVFFFLASNNLILDCNPEEADQAIVNTYKDSGLIKPYLTRLLSSKQTTAEALVDRLFASAIRLADVDILRDLFESSLDLTSRINQLIPLEYIALPIDFWAHATILPIHLALFRGDMELVGLLLRQGADLNYHCGWNRRSHNYSALDFAVFSCTGNLTGGSQILEIVLVQEQNITESKLIRALSSTTLAEARGMAADLHATALLDRLRQIALTSQLLNPTDALIYAIRYRHHEMINFLMPQGQGIDSPNRFGKTPLWEAVHMRNYQVCQTLLRAGAKPDPSWGASALQCAAYFGDVMTIRLLLEYHAEINRKTQEGWNWRNWELPFEMEFGRTALETAIRENQGEAVRLLLDMGAKCFGGELLQAIKGDNIAIVQELIGSGFSHLGGELAAAIRRGNHVMVELLVNCGAKWADVGEDGGTALTTAVFSQDSSLISCILASDSEGYDSAALAAAAHMAVLTKDTSTIQCLLERRGKQRGKREALFESLALGSTVFLGNRAIVELLMDHGICWSRGPFEWIYRVLGELRIEVPSYEEWSSKGERWLIRTLRAGRLQKFISLLELAVISRNHDMIHLLLRNGHQPDPGALLRAAQEGTVDTVEILLEAGACVNDRLIDRDTPLQVVIREDTEAMADLIEFLLQKGADVNAAHSSSDNFPRTALQAATEVGNLQLVKRLINLGAKVNAPAGKRRGATALQLAAMRGYLGVAKVLIEAGADFNAPAAEVDGRTALEGAAEYGHIDMLQYLLSIGTETDGDGREPYLRAIKFAKRECHFAAANLLRNHRPWFIDDHRLFDDMTDFEDDLSGDDDEESIWNVAQKTGQDGDALAAEEGVLLKVEDASVEALGAEVLREMEARPIDNVRSSNKDATSVSLNCHESIRKLQAHSLSDTDKLDIQPQNFQKSKEDYDAGNASNKEKGRIRQVSDVTRSSDTKEDGYDEMIDLDEFLNISDNDES